MTVKSAILSTRCLYLSIAICVCLLWIVDASSQTLNFKNYSVDDMLPSSKVYMVFQDSRGFIWFGTDLGVSRFDGNSFTHFSTRDGLADNEVFNLFEDSQGRIWFMTQNGKVSYHHLGGITNASTDSTLLPLNSNSFIASITEDDQGAIWITTSSDGIVRYGKDRSVKRFFGNQEFVSAYHLFFRKNNHAILAVSKGLFDIEFDKTRDSVLQISDLKVGSSTDDYYPKYVQTDSGEIVMKTNYEVRWYHPDKNSYGIIHQTRKEDQVYSLSQDGAFLWIGTSRGVRQYGMDDKLLRQSILENHLITSVLRDWEGNYWFSTLGEGVYFCTSLEMKCYTTKNGLLSDKVTCLAVDNQQRVWLGYDRGAENNAGSAVSFIDHNTVNTFPLLSGKAFNRMATRRIRFDKQYGWVATDFGMFRFKGTQAFLLPGYSRDMFAISRDSIWVGVGGSLCVIDNKVFERDKVEADKYKLDPNSVYLTEGSKLNEGFDRVKFFFQDRDGKLWVSAEKRMYYYAHSVFGTISYDALGIQTYVNDIAQLNDGTLVLSTNGNGVVFLKDGRNVFTINEEQGLTSNMCAAVSVDDQGVIWVGTNKGINRLEGYPDKLLISYVDADDGLLSNEVTDVLAVGGKVWVSTTKGVNFFDRSIQKRTLAPRIYIDYLSVEGKAARVFYGTNVSLSHKENDVSIGFTGLSYNNGDNMLYRYKLHPDEPWRFTRSNSVHLPELPSDQYHFTVSAKGRSGTWSEDTTISFVVAQAFWETLWFKIVCAFVVAGVLWFGLARYVEQQKKEMRRQHRVTLSELRSLRAQMNPHFVFNALNSIQGVLLKNNVATTQDYLSRFGKLMRTILDHSDKSRITIFEELESITNYLEIEVLRMNHQFRYTIHVDPTLDTHNTEIPAMILQPFIENAIWHGFGQKTSGNLLIIRFDVVDVYDVVITIEDNGIGRKKARELRTGTHRSKGVSLVQERIDILNSGSERKILLTVTDLEDTSGNAKGTSVCLKIPTQ